MADIFPKKASCAFITKYPIIAIDISIQKPIKIKITNQSINTKILVPAVQLNTINHEEFYSKDGFDINILFF